jgi:WD40 repeat protein
LSIRNRIYESTFTGKWVKEVIPIDWNRIITAAAVAVLLIGFVIWYTLILPKPYIETIRLAKYDVPTGAYDKLKKMPFSKTTAENLFADYWDRRALLSERQGNRDEGLIYHLKALTINESAVRRSEAEQLIGDDYKNLIVTFRYNRSSIYSVAFSSDGKTVLTGSDGGARLWQAATGKSLSPPMIYGSRVSRVYSATFSPDGKTIMAATYLWIHMSIVSDETTKPKASRLLPGIWTGAYRFLDDKGDLMQVAVRISRDSIKIINLRFDIHDAPPIQGDPAELLNLWQKKLALKLDEKTGMIEPLYQ